MSKFSKTWSGQLIISVLALVITFELLKYVTPNLIELIKPSLSMIEFVNILIKRADLIIYKTAPALLILAALVSIAFKETPRKK